MDFCRSCRVLSHRPCATGSQRRQTEYPGAARRNPEHNYSNQTETQLKQKALELHAGRIFDDREWVSYIPFHQRFRPQELEKAVLMWIETECCKRPGQVTKEQREKAVRMNERIICPHCGRLSGYRLCVPEKTE